MYVKCILASSRNTWRVGIVGHIEVNATGAFLRLGPLSSRVFMSAAGESRRCGNRVADRFCDGFRMPANADLSTGTRAGVRKPPKNETAGTRAPGGFVLWRL